MHKIFQTSFDFEFHLIWFDLILNLILFNSNFDFEFNLIEFDWILFDLMSFWIWDFDFSFDFKYHCIEYVDFGMWLLDILIFVNWIFLFYFNLISLFYFRFWIWLIVLKKIFSNAFNFKAKLNKFSSLGTAKPQLVSAISQWIELKFCMIDI